MTTRSIEASRPRPSATNENRHLALLRAFVGPNRGKAVLAVVLTLLISVTSSFGLLALVPLLGLIGLDVGSGSLGQVERVFVVLFDRIGVPLSLPVVLGAYIAIAVLSAFFVRIHSVIGTELNQDFVRRLQCELHDAITGARWLHFARQRGTDFTHGLTTEPARAGASGTAALALLVKTVMAATYVVLALVLEPSMTSLILLSSAFVGALLWRRTQEGKERGGAVTNAYKRLHGAVGETLAGMKLTKSHGLEEQHDVRFRDLAASVARSQTDMAKSNAVLSFWLQVGSVVSLSVILYVALEILAVDVAALLVLVYLFAKLAPSLSGIQRGYQQYVNFVPAYENVRELIDGCRRNAEEPVEDAPALVLERELRFERTSFRYASDGEAALREVDLTVPARKTVALVGSSGSGKSTVVDLAIGLLAPDGGSVRIDGVPLAGASRRAWRRSVGYVAQDTFLFHDTIRANLRVVRPDASDAEMHEALRVAAAEFALELPNGLDTIVGDRGVALSGGERQRLALARALLRAPSLLVLDEATSSLDAENERRIQAAIEELQGRMTILLIAHRLSTVRSADVIYVLENGRVVEHGGWDELMQRGGRFRALWTAQGGEPPAGG